MSFFNELKRRNVFRVGIAYAITAWLLAQMADVLLGNFGAPEWVVKTFLLALSIGFPLALLFAWAFELTPEGLKRDHEVERGLSIAQETAGKLDRTIIFVLVLALVWFSWDKFIADPKRDKAEFQARLQQAAVETAAIDNATESDRTIAVLPFVNMSEEAGNEYFADGLSEELLNMLSKVPELRVAARTSSFSFKDQDVTIAEIADKLKVAHVLEGSVRKSGDRVRITAQLIHAEDGFHLWSETYDRTLVDIFATQDEIATAVTDALKVNLLGATESNRETRPEVYELFLKGRHEINRQTKEGFERAGILLEEAVALDPEYAPAWALLAIGYLYQSNYSPREFDDGMKLASIANARAIELDPDQAFAWTGQGYYQGYYEWDWKGAEVSYAKALKIDPGNAAVINSVATFHTFVGEFEKAIALREKAYRLDPLGAVSYLISLSYNYATTGQTDKALMAIREVMEHYPDPTNALGLLARNLLLNGEAAEALRALDSSTDLDFNLEYRAMVLYSLGKEEEADALASAIAGEPRQGGAYRVALYYAWRGDPDAAFAALEQAYANRYRVMAYILGEPILYPLHTDPRWTALLEKMGLLEYWLAMPPKYGGPGSSPGR